MSEEVLSLLEKELSEYEYQLKTHTVAAKRKLVQYKEFDSDRNLEISCSLKESYILLGKLLSRMKEVRQDFRRLPESLFVAAFTSGAPLESVVKTEIDTEIVLAKLETKLVLFSEFSRRTINRPVSPTFSIGQSKTGLEEQLAENLQKDDCSSTFAVDTNENGKKSFTKRVFG